MCKSMIGAALAATLLLGTAPAAQAGGYYGGPGASGSVSGGGCTGGQFATGFSSTGVPTCATIPSTALPYVSGRVYPLTSIGTPNAAAMTANRQICFPVSVRNPIVPPTLGVRVTTAAAAGTLISIDIFATDPLGNPTGTALASATDIDGGTAGGQSKPNTGLATLQPGVLYNGCINTTAAPSLAANTVNPNASTGGVPSYADIPSVTSSGFTGVYLGGQTYSSTAPRAIPASPTWSPNNGYAVAIYFTAP